MKFVAIEIAHTYTLQYKDKLTNLYYSKEEILLRRNMSEQQPQIFRSS